ncbi:inactive N-acetylated-alpha-linked acidic dipeptidase-like protein 2 [Trematomus bernacchii]|uniref:inactive N-acetylated-alpha-linked acidic dipeptidase-like protein 2 n=1 Tax=Trematomus bernacchii TaxID=40690 RepID=UPI00146BE6EC|nr:inactive N-acetylated-alpha-linked acidic dipeptidase-like protein 2 [Trematomus bernacchii]
MAVFPLLPLCVLLLSLHTLGGASPSCPVSCRCYSLTVECGSTSLRDIPKHVPPSTQTIFLQDNVIGQIRRQDLTLLKHLHYLYLQNNSISAVEPGSFQNQGQLLELALNGNRVHLVTADMFQGLEHLRILYLAGNDITRLLDYTFRGLQGEVVDVHYAGVDDLRRAKDSLNLTNQIALVKLGRAPLLYKLSLLSELGFGGVLLYIDPCDAPPGSHTWHQAFRVTLNPGGNPAISEVSREAGRSLTSLLVQPISAFLAKTLLSSSSTGQGDSCVPLARPPNTERKKITLTVGNHLSSKKIYNVVGYLKGKRNPDRYVLVGSRHDSDQGGGASAIMNQLIAALTEQTKQAWVPDRTTVFCSWGGSALGNIGSYEWGKDNSVVLQSSAVAYVSLNSPVRGTETLRATASPTLLQLTLDIQRRQLLSCIRGGNCPGPNVSSLQLPGDVNFFANQLAVPTVEFAFEQTKAEETTSFLSEAQFSAESPETLDPLFKFHETIAKMTAEAILRLVNDPVLPFYPLDIALDVQNKLKDKSVVTQSMLSTASSLRDHAAFFQSETMRPANDPKERDPSHVRMLNDVLRDLEKSFILPHTPPGVYRNLLYSLPGRTPQFSVLRFSQEAVLHCNVTSRALKHNSAAKEVLCHSTLNQSLSLILRAIRSAERLVCFGMGLFENYPNNKK